MNYRKSEAKEYAKKNMKGIWGATLTPFTPDYRLDEDGIRQNIRHFIDTLQLGGLFLNGLQGEGFSQTITERKRVFKIAIEESKGDTAIMPYTADPVLENVVEMTRYAEDNGADYAIIINPKFYFGSMTDEGVFRYYKYIADRVNIGIVLFNQMEHGYLMSPQLINRIATIENIVAVKDFAPGPDIMQARFLCGDKIVVSENSEDNWLINNTVRGQQAMIATVEPFCLQSGKLKLINEYTNSAMKGEIAKAWEISRKVEPLRRVFKNVTVPSKRQATYKYWIQFLGMAGGDGRVRLPLMELTETEKKAIQAAVEGSGLI
jgi:4-hydroxy-tetrahydrodipicolinate synthase